MTATTAGTTTVERALKSMLELESDPQLYAPGAVSWHNFDEIEVSTVPESYDAVRAIRAVMPDFTMSDIRAHQVGENISVAQYIVTGTLPDGATLRAPGVLVAHSENGLVTRLEEYLDTAQLGPLFALLEG